MSRPRRPLLAAGVTLAAVLTTGTAVAGGPAGGGAAPAPGSAFLPTPVSQDRYGTGPVERQDLVGPGPQVIGLDVSRPVARDGAVPPDRVPVALVMTPYALLDTTEQTGAVQDHADVVRLLTRHGYAVAVAHVPGTGRSTGCPDPQSPAEVEATVRVLEHLTGAPWSTGAVGMYGISYDALTQVAVAGHPDRARVRGLRAIVPVAAFGSEYDALNSDGVPYDVPVDGTNNTWGGTFTLVHPASDPRCRTHHVDRLRTDLDGSFTAFYQERDRRAAASRTTAAVFAVVGEHEDHVGSASAVADWYRLLPDTTPRTLLYGQWKHEFPDQAYVFGAPDRSLTTRHDWDRMVLAWYDRHLQGLDSGVDAWPAVQVQSRDHVWRAEPAWPGSGARPGHLRLGGALRPVTSARYLEQEGAAVFETAPLAEDLRLTGTPVLDLHLLLGARDALGRPDAHVAVDVVVLGRDGAQGSPLTTGARSARHLDPMPLGFFAQAGERLPDAGAPVRVPVRLKAVDATVPAGSRLQVRVGGDNSWYASRSGARGPVTVLTGCATPSVLRFRLPAERPQLLDVQDRSRDEVPVGVPPTRWSVDGGGLASAAVCGVPPRDPLEAVGAGG